MLLNIFLSIIARPFLLIALGAFLIMMAVFASIAKSKNKPQKPKTLKELPKMAYFAWLFMFLSILNLIFGARISNHLINKHGEPGTGVVLREETTNNLYNEEPVYRYPVLLITAEAKKVETYFETNDFNVYPNSGSARYPAVGEEFNLKYLEKNPNRFVILANEGNYSDVLNCQALREAMNEAEIKMNFDEGNEAFEEAFEQAKEVYEASNC